MSKGQEILSTREVAAKYGVEVREVIYAAKRGLLKGTKMGWVWTFKAKELPVEWPVNRRKKGVS